MKKLFWAALAALLLMTASGLSEREYRVVAPQVNEEALLMLCFGERAGEAELEAREYGFLHWSLPGVPGVPFAGYGADSPWQKGVQSRINIFRVNDETRGGYAYCYNQDESNTLPEESGFATPRAQEIIEKAREALDVLGIQGAEPVSFTAMGRIRGTTKCYKALFQKTLNGRPVRFSARLLMDDENFDNVFFGNYLTVIFSDEEGLLKLEGEWCDFEAIGGERSALSPEEAAQRFAEIGYDMMPEACYFMTRRTEGIIAVPAYRVGGNTLDALTGAWLETE